MAPLGGVLLLLLLLLRTAESQEATDGVVTLPQGVLRGAINPGNASRKFLNIPYAQAPIGTQRWRAPAVPAPSWAGVRNASVFGPKCLQVWEKAGAEDCLMLNVFAPRSAIANGSSSIASRIPVMVWFHGGCFTGGSPVTDDYDGSAMVALAASVGTPVIVVTVGFRLNAFGHLASDAILAADGTTGNQGLLDQRESLRWVRDNIGVFGGDASRVTIFGQSSGAGSVAVHLVSPGSWGLFHRAIIESGSFPNWIAHSRGAAQRNYDALIGETECASVDASAESGQLVLDCLAGLDAEVLRAAAAKVATPCRDGCEWAPVVDGPSGFLADLPWKLLRDGQIAPGVDVLHGSNLEDGSGFVNDVDTIPLQADAEQTATYLADVYQPPRGGDATTSPIYPTLETLYSVDDPRDKLPPAVFNASNPAAFDANFTKAADYSAHFWSIARVETDFAYRCSARRTSRDIARARAAANVNRTAADPNPLAPGRAYRYNWHQHSAPTPFVTHGAELPYVFGSKYDAAATSRGDAQSQQISQLSLDVISMWTQFAYSGDPTENGAGSVSRRGVAWAVDEGLNESEVMNLGDMGSATIVDNGVADERCEFWDSVWETWGGKYRKNGGGRGGDEQRSLKLWSLGRVLAPPPTHLPKAHSSHFPPHPLSPMGLLLTTGCLADPGPEIPPGTGGALTTTEITLVVLAAVTIPMVLAVIVIVIVTVTIGNRRRSGKRGGGLLSGSENGGYGSAPGDDGAYDQREGEEGEEESSAPRVKHSSFEVWSPKRGSSSDPR